MAFIPPPRSRRQVDITGQRFREGSQIADDLVRLEHWRASHLYVINTFQSSLRGRRKRSGSNISIAQRLKRRPTILDKLRREPGMALSRMHDIAGCRLIFDSIPELRSFREGVLSSRAQHELVGGENRYDYISSPKNSGYRGIHDVYKYSVSSNAGEAWNGLRIEIQYRTLVQHAWSTAVEINDIVNSTRVKFGESAAELERLFLLASEILSRAHENIPGFCSTLANNEILEELNEIDSRLRVIEHLRQLSSPNFRQFARTSRLFILVNPLPGEHDIQFQAVGFVENRRAVEQYAEMEKQYAGRADVVLVGASEQDSVRLAYTNYFSDASEFLELLGTGMKRLA